MKVLFGTDTEFFILDREGRPVPAHRFFPGKDDKIFFNIKSRGKGAMFRDGYGLELNVPPTHCRSVLVDSLNVAMAKAMAKMPKGYRLSTIPTMRIDLASLRRAPYDVQQFGCDPVMDAYLKDERSVDLDGAHHPLRYTGAHFHFSIKSKKDIPAWMKNFDDMCLFAKMLDLYVGVPLTVMFKSKGMFARRKHYGLAGEFRLQTYHNGKKGFEYRVPTSEVWNDPAVAMMVMGIGRDLINRFEELKERWSIPGEKLIRAAVNTGAGAEKLLASTPFYTPRLILRAAEQGRFRRFDLRAHKPVPHGTICDFPGWLRAAKLIEQGGD